MLNFVYEGFTDSKYEYEEYNSLRFYQHLH